MTGDQFLLHCSCKIWKLLIVPAEISQREQQRLKWKNYDPGHQNFKTYSIEITGKTKSVRTFARLELRSKSLRHQLWSSLRWS